MGFFDDLAMGFGQKPKTKDYEARTARTIARTDPQGAERYMASRGVTSADIGNMSPSTYVGYQSLSDMFDGGGPGRSGARFSSQNTAAFDTNKDNYVSEKEYVSAETAMPDVFSQTQGGIASLSNAFGARPRGSYAQERGLGAEGINIGTSGIADYFAGGGMLGNIVRGGAPSSLQRAELNVPIGNSLDPAEVQSFNELAPDRVSLFEKMTQGNTGPNFVMSTQNRDNSSSVLEPVPEPDPEPDPEIRPIVPTIHIAPLPRRAGGGLVSLVRR